VEGLRDIKSVVEIHEYSFFIFLSLIIATLLLVWIFYYFYKNRRKRRKKPTKRELALKRLKEIDFDDTKSAIYTFSVDGDLFVDATNQTEFQEIEKLLQKYKYQKETSTLDKKVKEMMIEFIRGLK